MNKHLAQIAGSTTLRFKTDILAAALAIVATCLLAGCKTENPATVTDNRELAASTIARPSVIYVTDFELGVENIKHEDGKLSGKSGVVGRVGGRLSGTSSDPEARARKLVDLMSSSLVKDLCQAGFNAFRLPPGTALPAEGWLIRGVFTEVQEGNRLRRSMIGFGEGQTERPSDGHRPRSRARVAQALGRNRHRCRQRQQAWRGPNHCSRPLWRRRPLCHVRQRPRQKCKANRFTNHRKDCTAG